ncbi:hypothetical protein KQI33_00735 [Enterococcus devriesei]|uniref:hypothetical protein n=1 Tax=Enterococcus devriesei TaxID=319970 RepID=UPI001C10E4A4|nr:hypothetical protein [Enterococcus devriesei]MBU5363898.1 hypothetical protein [Enterococcus devriesei]
MRVGIVSISNIKHMTLISLYTDILKKNKIDYDFIYVDKYNISEKNDADNIFKYVISIKKNSSSLKKAIKYAGFIRFAKKIIRDNNYDLLIVWGSGTGYILSRFLVNRWKEKYIYNIRDYGYENKKIISILQNKIVKNSLFTTISSKKFLDFLPSSSKYIFVNSINPKLTEELLSSNSSKITSKAIRICFIGYVRFIENDKKLLLALKNDSRFIVQYFGAKSDILKKFAEENGIKNTEFIDSFDSSQTSELLMKADVINNLYGNDDTALDTAISIKYYYSILLNLPILVWKNTYMEEITKDFPGVFVFDGNYNGLNDRLYTWYSQINKKRMIERNSKLVKDFRKENTFFENKFADLFREAREEKS